MKYFTHIFFVFLGCLLLLLSENLFAQPVDRVEVFVARSDIQASPAVGLQVELVRVSTSESFTATTDSSGLAVFTFLETDSYTLKIAPYNNPMFANNLIYRDIVKTVSVDYLSAEANPPNYIPTQTFSEQLAQFPKILEAKFYFAKSLALQYTPDLTRPIVGAHVGFQLLNDQPGPPFVTNTDNAGIARLGVELTTAGPYTAKIDGIGAVSRLFAENIPLVGLTDTDIFATPESDAMVHVQLKNSVTGANHTLSNQFDANVVCDATSGLQSYVFASIPDNTLRLNGTIPVPSISGLSSYTCRTFFKDAGFGADVVTFSTLSPSTIPRVFNAKVYSVDADITYHFIDAKTQLPITAVQAKVDIFSDDTDTSALPITYDSHDTKLPGVSSLTMPVLSGHSYRTQIKLEGSSPGEAPGYSLTDFTPIIDMSAGGSKQIYISLLKTNATIAVSLIGTEGQAIQGGFASASAFTPSSNGSADKQYFVNVPLDTAGKAALAVIPGVTYEVRVFPPKNTSQEGGDYLLPAPQYVQVKENETESHVFALGLPNYFVTVLPELSGEGSSTLSLAEAYSVRCRIKNAAGEVSGSEELDDGKSLLLSTRVAATSKSETLGLGCHIVFDTPGDGLNGEVYFGRAAFSTKGGETERTIFLVVENLGKFFEEQQEQFSPDQAQTFSFADGKTSLRVGAGAFGSGTTATLTTETGAVSVDTDLIPLTVWSITPSVDSIDIEEPEQTVEFCYTVSEEELAKYGLSSREGITIQRYDDDADQWVPASTTIVGDDVCAELDHFSLWGAIIDVAKTLKEITPQLKIRKVKGKWAVLKWKVESETMTGAEQFLLEYSTRVKNSKKCTAVVDFPSSQVVTGEKKRLKLSKKNKKALSSKICARLSYLTADEDPTYSSKKFKRQKR